MNLVEPAADERTRNEGIWNEKKSEKEERRTVETHEKW